MWIWGTLPPLPDRLDNRKQQGMPEKFREPGVTCFEKFAKLTLVLYRVFDNLGGPWVTKCDILGHFMATGARWALKSPHVQIGGTNEGRPRANTRFRKPRFHSFHDFWRLVFQRQEKRRTEGALGTSLGSIYKTFSSPPTVNERIGDINKTNTPLRRKPVFEGSEPATI